MRGRAPSESSDLPAAFARGRPPNGLIKRAVRVDELLKRPIERACVRGGHRLHLIEEAAKEAHVEGVSTRRGKGIVTRAVAIGKGNVKEGVQALRRGLHAKTATHQLQTPYREGRAIRQEHVTCGETVCHKGDARLVLGVALVVGPSLGGHARKRVRVDLGGTCRHMGDTTAGEALRQLPPGKAERFARVRNPP